MALPAFIAAGGAIVKMITTRIPAATRTKLMQHMTKSAGLAWDRVKHLDVVAFMGRMWSSVNSVGKLSVLLIKGMIACELLELAVDAWEEIRPYISADELPAVEGILRDAGLSVQHDGSLVVPDSKEGPPRSGGGAVIDITPVGGGPGRSSSRTIDIARFRQQDEMLSAAVRACGSHRNFMAIRAALINCDDNFLASRSELLGAYDHAR